MHRCAMKSLSGNGLDPYSYRADPGNSRENDKNVLNLIEWYSSCPVTIVEEGCQAGGIPAPVPEIPWPSPPSC